MNNETFNHENIEEAIEIVNGEEVKTKSSEEVIQEEKPVEEIEVEVLDCPEDIRELVNSINEKDLMSILNFGNEASEEITKVSDVLLAKTTPTEGDNTNTFINNITNMVEQFNPENLNSTIEDKSTPKTGVVGFFKKMLSSEESTEEKSDKIVKKFSNMEDSVNEMASQLKTMEYNTRKTNDDLDTLEKAGYNSYKKLEKYIKAGQIKQQEIANKIKKMEEDGLEDTSKQLEYQSLVYAKDVLDQKIFNLKVSEQVSLQTIPQIQVLKHNNVNLAIGIKQAVDSTLPMFKNGLSIAIINKKQELDNQAVVSISNASSKIMKNNTAGVMVSSKKIMESNTNLQVYKDVASNYQELKKGLESIKLAKEANMIQREEASKELDRIKSEIKEIDMKDIKQTLSSL